MNRFLIAVAACLAGASCSSPRAKSEAGEVESTGERELARAIAQSDALRAAQSAIDHGHPWRATQLIAPTLRNPAKRTPAALIVAARAAAGWDGWAEVDKLLGKESWVDSAYDGEARELLTRSALERGADTAAVTDARAALRDSKSAEARAVRNVYLARALERSNYFDSAAVLYGAAGEALGPVSDWLYLRAAGVQNDSSARARSYARLRSAVARARIPWTEAQSRERGQDALGAARRYAALGATVAALRLRLSVAPDSASRDAIRAELLTFIRSHAGTTDARTAVDVLDRAFKSMAASEELVVARSLAASGPPARAVVGFERALSQPGLVTPADRLSYAQVLARINRSRDALAQLALVDGPLAGQAGYQRARIYLTSGTGDQVRAALRDVVQRFPGDTGAASAALYLLADLTTDAGNDEQARSLYQQLYRSYTSSSRAAEARFNAAIISYALGEAKAAALQFDSLVAVYPRSSEAQAARYWSGRAYAVTGDSQAARQRWRDVVGSNAFSYYSVRAAQRVAERPWLPPARADSFTVFKSIDSALARIELLDRLGMDTESRFEMEALEESAGSSPEKLAATAHAFAVHGQAPRAIRLAQKLIDAGQRDARSYRLLYPLVDAEQLEQTSKANQLDPWLVAGLIRQESNFNPRAVSSANARGLMQVLPAVGEEVAGSLGYPVWYPALLLDPDANLQLGTAHLAGFSKQYGALPRVLAAYNAGGSRVTRWSARRGMDDPELFAERIPFVETRDYVRQVQRNAEMYRALYGK